MICWDHQHSLLHLDLQVDISAVWSVGPQTSMEEIWDLYYQVYKLRRLPRYLPCGPEWADALVRDIVSPWKTIKAERGWAARGGCPPDVKQNPMVREGRHLGQSPAGPSERSPPEGLGNHHGFRREDRAAELVHHQGLPWCTCPFPNLGQMEEQAPGAEPNVLQGPTWEQPGPLPSTQPSTMGGWRGGVWPAAPTRAGAQCGEVLPQSHRQVWRRHRGPFSHRTPGRGIWEVNRMERASCGYPWLVVGAGEILEVDDIQKLAQKIQASFKPPQWMSKKHNVENCYLALLAPHCIFWEDFLSLPDLRFPCWDLWEEQWKKTMIYAQTLQYWAERANLPMLGWPHLLVGSVLELQKVMELHISFPDDIILGSVALLEGFFGSQT